MKPLLRLLTVVLVGALLSTACSTAPDHGSRAADEIADLVLRGGRVATVDDALPEAEAVAVRGAYVVAVGTNEEIEAWIGPETRVVELDGRLLTPGFIEGHGHFMGLGNAELILDLSQAATWEEIVSQVADAAAGALPGEWIRGRGWHQEKWDESPTDGVDGYPVHAALSAVSPDNPVLLGHASGHASFANAMAMDLAGIGRDSEPPAGGEYGRDAEGDVTGLMRETAQRVVGRVMGEALAARPAAVIEAEARKMVELAGLEALSHGVTSFHDAGVDFDTIDFFKALEAEGELPIRLYAMVRYASNDEMEARLPEYRMEAEGNDFLAVRSIKRQIDGALGAHGAWLLEPYEDLPTSTGLVLEPEEDIRRTAELAIEHGFQVNTHAIGDRANRVVLDIYEETFASAGDRTDLRWRIEHAQHVHPDDLLRFAPLGVIASMQGVHCTSDASWVPQRIGDERARTGAYMWRTLIDNGVVINNGTDVPVERIDPIASYHASISRLMGNGETFYPEQSMTREEALRSYTLNNAYAAFEETSKGSISVGKLADLAVLSVDILSAPLEEIPETRVDLTIVGGEVRFEREVGTRPRS